MENENIMDPNHVPEELQQAYDVIELPSQGILYENKKSTVKVEHLNALDENILASPNILSSGDGFNILLKRKIKDLGFDVDDLIEGDRIALLIFLRSTGISPEHRQLVVDKGGKIVEGIVDLSTLKTKKLEVKPDDQGEFDYEFPHSGTKIKFRLLTGKDEREIDEIDKRSIDQNEGVSQTPSLRLERSIMQVGEVRDKMKIRHMIHNGKIGLMDVRKFKKYVSEIEPGIDLKTTALTPGGESVECFLKIGRDFWYPEV